MKRPFAYVCSPYGENPKLYARKAKAYCRKLYDLGYMPIAPHLLFPQFLNENIPTERSEGMEMAKELLRRSRVVVVCGKELSDGMIAEMTLARRLGITMTTLDGIEKIDTRIQEEQEQENEIE